MVRPVKELQPEQLCQAICTRGGLQRIINYETVIFINYAVSQASTFVQGAKRSSSGSGYLAKFVYIQVHDTVRENRRLWRRKKRLTGSF